MNTQTLIIIYENSVYSIYVNNGTIYFNNYNGSKNKIVLFNHLIKSKNTNHLSTYKYKGAYNIQDVIKGTDYNILFETQFDYLVELKMEKTTTYLVINKIDIPTKYILI